MAPERLQHLNHGDRVFIHDPNPPYQLWSGVVAYSELQGDSTPVWHIGVDVPGLHRRSYPSHDQVHPEPYRPLEWCEWCVALLAAAKLPTLATAGPPHGANDPAEPPALHDQLALLPK